MTRVFFNWIELTPYIHQHLVFLPFCCVLLFWNLIRRCWPDAAEADVSQMWGRRIADPALWRTPEITADQFSIHLWHLFLPPCYLNICSWYSNKKVLKFTKHSSRLCVGLVFAFVSISHQKKLVHCFLGDFCLETWTRSACSQVT